MTAPTTNRPDMKLAEKTGYACGDVASNIYWRTIDLFLLIFYTDVFGIPAATVGTMMLVTRLIDAVSDPVMGALADRTQSRFGKFRPYLLWGIIPLAAAGVLTFSVPDLDQDGKTLYAYATYTTLMLTYTFINVPYGALLGVMTSDSQQRTTLTSFRFIGAFSGGTLVAYFTPELVTVLGNGNGDDALGWQRTMILYGLCAAGLFILTFFATKERISPVQVAPTPIGTDLRDLISNRPWVILFCLALIIMVTISLRASTGTFYFKYVVQREDLIGAFSMVYMLSLAVGAAITPWLTRWMDKRNLLMLLMGMVAALSALFYFIPSDAIGLLFVVQGLIGLCLGPKSPLVFSMYADTADYSEWRTKRRATAMVFSAAAFSQKLGGAMAGATIGWLLAYMGYQPNAVQSDASETGISLLMTFIPAAFAVIAVLVVRLYPLTEAQLTDMQADLENMRQAHDR